MTTTQKLAGALVTAALIAAASTGCSTSSSNESPTSAGARQLIAASPEEHTARLTDLETATARMLAAEAGLDLAPSPAAADTGGSGSGAGSAQLASFVRATQPSSSFETVATAANSLGMLNEVVAESLGNASLNSDGGTEHSAAPGANPATSYTVSKGTSTGSYSSSISDTNEAGDSVTVAIAGEFEFGVCPDPQGAVNGQFLTDAAVTFTPAGGAATRSAMELDMETFATVGDDAYTRTILAKATGALRTGAPASDSPTRVPESASFETEENGYFFEFGDQGVGGVGSVEADEQLDGVFSAQVDDLAEQIVQILMRTAEDYWRSGGCVEPSVYPEDATPMPGTHQTIAVEAVSRVDGEIIDTGTVEWLSVDGDSTVDPTGSFDLGKIFAFTAGSETGPADPVFEVITRRGIGRLAGSIMVVGDSWSFTGSYGGGEYRGYSCTGMTGPWTLSVYVPAITQGWSTNMTFDDSLSSGYQDAGTGPGPWADPDARYWFTADGDGYLFHADPYDPSFAVRSGPVEECMTPPEGSG